LAAIPVLERARPGSRAWPVPFDQYDFDLFWKWPDYNEPFGVEVKNDRLAERTGRIAIEHRSIGKSTALFALYRFSGAFWLIHMSDLKGMIGRYPETVGGDTGDYTLTLVPEREFVRQAIYLR
jgi:hypothetical protein